MRNLILSLVLTTNVWAQKAERIEGPQQDPTARASAAFPSIRELVTKLPARAEFFDVAGCHAFLIIPKAATTSLPTPWVWYAPTIGGHPNTSHAWMFKQFLQQGMVIAGVDVGESMGNPRGRAAFNALHMILTQKHGLSKQACLMPQSRGGLMLYNWAAENPGHVACIAGIYPVCDMSSWPGLKTACTAYGMSEEQLASVLSKHNPIDRLAALAKVGVPILHVHGDSDTVVPLERNSAELAQRYRRLGGRMKVIVVPRKGHEVVPEYFRCRELVDFVTANARITTNKRNTGM